MSVLKQELSSLIDGDVSDLSTDLDLCSHDASLFEIRPQLVVYPKNTEDVRKLVAYVAGKKTHNPNLSLTPRAGGTDMSGGAINDSIVVSFNKYFNKIRPLSGKTITAQPGVFYKDFEPTTLASGLLLPSYPASREICMIGGMVANNSGGEKSLKYGKTEDYVDSLSIVLADGNEYTMHPLSEQQLNAKIQQNDFEGRLYSRVFSLIKKNQELIMRSKPKVSKNSTGYNIWDVWDGHTFDLSKLIVGSQGTLGLLTSTTFKLVPALPLSGMVVVFMPNLKKLGEIINTILPLKPSSFESFDEHTLVFALRFFFSFRKTLGWKRFILLGVSFIPLLNKLLRYLPNLPKMILLIEFEGNTQDEIDQKIKQVEDQLSEYDVETQVADDKKHEEKFWLMRRESFNLLRRNVKKVHAAPFIDDLIVPPQHLPKFLPRLEAILEHYKLMYTVAGHMGDGNFHIIPLMNLADPADRAKIPKVLGEVTDLILEYGGSLSGEHNDGLIRGPYLKQMYGREMLNIFRQVKDIFDPHNIFNPHKKVMATKEYNDQHIRQNF